MLHEPATSSGKDLAAAQKSRLGIWMFLLYLLVYAGFVAINLIDPSLMEKTVLLGLNLATVYGFGLIIFALIEALVYNSICLAYEKRVESQAKDEEK
jgi:uncharacterized membrane protein (DUF485 family)